MPNYGGLTRDATRKPLLERGIVGVTLSLDHLFVMTAPEAPGADRLAEFGLAEGSPNRHPGQGTACRRFFFHNAMLELLWVDDPDEIRNDRTRPTQLWQRWSEREHDSPFGVCFRPESGPREALPFDTWSYRPEYLPDSLTIEMASDNPLSEPLWFYLGFGQRPDARPEDQREPLVHPVGFHEVTAVTIEGPGLERLSETATALAKAGIVALRVGETHLMEVVFDGGSAGRREDFRPELPLVFRW